MNLCGNEIWIPDRSVGAERRFLCGEDLVETTDGRILCVVCNESDLEEYAWCPGCGLYVPLDEACDTKDQPYCKECCGCTG